MTSYDNDRKEVKKKEDKYELVHFEIGIREQLKA